MKHFNTRIMVLGCASLIGMSLFGASATTNKSSGKSLPGKAHPEIFASPKPEGSLHWIASEVSEPVKKSGIRKTAIAEPVQEYKGIPKFNYITAPDGSMWFYTSKFESDSVNLASPGWDPVWDYRIKSFSFTIYDETFNEIGTVKDEVTMAEDEVRAVEILIDGMVTDKFFNNDSKPEIMVYHAMNTTRFQNRYYYKVYSVGGEKDENGNDKALMRWEGKSIGALRVTPDAWTTDYYSAFTNGSTAGKITIYKKAGWNPEPTPILTYEVPETCIPGDTTDGAYYMTKIVDGKPYFVFMRYKYQLFEDPAGYSTNDNLTPDNELLIDVYTMKSPSDKEATHVSSTVIPVEQLDNSEEMHWVFYSVGSLAGSNDIDMSYNGTPSSPVFILQKQYCLASNDENRDYSYCLVDVDGNIIKELTNLSDGVTMLGNIEGHQPQAMFIELDDADEYTFHMTDLYSGEETATISQKSAGRQLTSECNRVPYGVNDFKYAFGVIPEEGDMDEDGNDIVCMAWFNSDGTFDRLDKFNVGKNVMGNSVNMSASVLNPYIFDTDDAMEYAVLVKRTNGETSYDEFVITDDSGTPYANFNAEDGLGDPYSFSVVFSNEKNYLQMIYYDWESSNYNIALYDLPFVKMAGGSGTEADPYQISTIADLQYVRENPSSYYVIINDLDGSEFNFKPIDNFTGSIDGQSHNISNINIQSYLYTGVFSNLYEARIKNINFIDPVLNVNGASYAGVIAGMASQVSVDGINVYNMTLKNDEFNGMFGGILGQISNSSTITSCQVSSSEISLPKAQLVGGIVGNVRTSSSILASSFSGSIEGKSEVGGISGQVFGTGNLIENCHVSADIVAQNNVGGIVGSGDRSIYKHNYVEGSLVASTPSGQDKFYSIGGIVGALTPLWDNDAESTVIVSDNIVALNSIETPSTKLEEAFPGQKSTAHRIVGSSTANTFEEIYDNKTGEWIAGDPKEEFGLANNYSLASLAPCDSNVEATETSSEGKSIDSISHDFLKDTLGFAFGTDVDHPWYDESDSDPWLYIESSFIALNRIYKVKVDDSFTVDLRFMEAQEVSAEALLKELEMTYDESIIKITDNISLANNVLSIGFEALKEGDTDIEIKYGSTTTHLNVTVKEKELSGIENVIDQTSAVSIKFVGNSVICEGASIEIYNAGGVKVLGGFEKVSVSELSKGIYVAIAIDGNGNRSSLKIAL